MYHQGPPLHYFGILDMHFLGLEFEAYVLISMSEISRETLDGDSESERRPQICMVWYGMSKSREPDGEGQSKTFIYWYLYSLFTRRSRHSSGLVVVVVLLVQK